MVVHIVVLTKGPYSSFECMIQNADGDGKRSDGPGILSRLQTNDPNGRPTMSAPGLPMRGIPPEQSKPLQGQRSPPYKPHKTGRYEGDPQHRPPMLGPAGPQSISAGLPPQVRNELGVVFCCFPSLSSLMGTVTQKGP